MSEFINEKISVNLFTNHVKGTADPTGFFWRGRSYKITQIGLHHAFWQGRNLIHVFSATDGNTFFKLQLDTETLLWKLLEVETNE